MSGSRPETVLGRCSASWPWWLLFVGLAVAIVLGVLLELPASLIAALAVAASALAVLPFTSITLVRRADALVIEYGPLGWPRQRVPLADIERAEEVEIRPREWGGWGYRGSRTLGKRAAIVLRRGPGIALHLRDGKKLLISIDDADRALARLRAAL